MKLEAFSARLTHSENDPMPRTHREILRLGALSVRLTQSENDLVLTIPPVFIMQYALPKYLR